MEKFAPERRAWRRVRLYPGTLDGYLLKKLFTPFLLIEAGVVLFLELERALRLVYELSLSGADLGYFFPLLLRLVPYFVGFGLPFAFFLALLLLLSRLDDDLELQAMLASGMAISRIARPLVVAGIAVAGIALITSGWLEPHCRFAFRTLKVEAINSGRTARLVPGDFFAPSDSLVMRVAPISLSLPERIFVWHRGQGGQKQVMTAHGAEIGLSADGARIEIALRKGTALIDDRRAGHDGAHLLDFDRMTASVPVKLDDAGWSRGRDERELTLPELINPGPERLTRLGRNAIEAELYGRLGKAALIPLLPLLVLPLAMAGSRGNRIPGAIAAEVLLLLAQNALNMVRHRAAHGQIEALPYMAMIVGSFAVLQVSLMVAGRNLPSHSPMSIVLDGLNRLTPQLNLRRRVILTFPGRRMASYIAVRVLLWTMLSGAALVVLLEMAEIFLAGDVFVRRGLDTSDVFYYGVLRAPAHAMQALPAAALVGPVIAFFLLVRRRELLTVGLMGISQMRLLAMLLPVPLLLGAVNYGLSEYAVPRSEQAFQTWWRQSQETDLGKRAHWFSFGDNMVRAGGASPDGRLLDEVMIVRLDRNGTIAERIEAHHAQAVKNGWRLDAVRRLTIDKGIVSTFRQASEIWVTSLRPDDVRVAVTATTTYSSSWARRALAGEVPASTGESAYRTRIWRGGSMVLLPLLMLLIALPIASASPIGHGSTVVVAYAVTAGSVVLVADGLLTVMAMMGMIPVFMGVWAVPACAATLALAVIMRQDR